MVHKLVNIYTKH